jgi:hypothetical protein
MKSKHKNYFKSVFSNFSKIISRDIREKNNFEFLEKNSRRTQSNRDWRPLKNKQGCRQRHSKMSPWIRPHQCPSQDSMTMLHLWMNTTLGDKRTVKVSNYERFVHSLLKWQLGSNNAARIDRGGPAGGNDRFSARLKTDISASSSGLRGFLKICLTISYDLVGRS